MNNELTIYSKGLRAQQELSPALQKKRAEITSQYGDRVAFLNAFSPDKQYTLCQDDKIAILDDSPTLTELNATYGKSTASMFLVPQLFNISEFCGAREKFTEGQIMETAQLIAVSYPWLKVKEVMTFCKQFKLGRYGQFYGSVDPMVITRALKEFLSYRADIYAEYEEFKAQRRIEQQKKEPTMSFEEWQQEKIAKGEKVNLSMSVVQEGRDGKSVRIINPIETFVEKAQNLVTNKYNLSMKSLLEMRKMFREQNGMTPEEVIEKSNNNEL
jgi:hypothetical protein